MAEHRVGPTQVNKSINDAYLKANPNDTILVDPGEYKGKLACCAIYKGNLTIKCSDPNGIALLNARDDRNYAINVQDKGIWVLDTPDLQVLTVEGIDFIGANIPSNLGNNGAGIRISGGSINAKRCTFYYNQNGILATNERVGTLYIADCEFAFNGTGSGYEHNIYTQGTEFFIERCVSRNVNTGQCIKTRASKITVQYCIIGESQTTDKGNSNVEIDLPNGGVSKIIGNLILQNPSTDNSHMLSIGQEGADPSKQHSSLIIHNTFAGYRNPNVFVRHNNTQKNPYPGPITSQNNIFTGSGDTYEYTQPSVKSGNFESDAHSDAYKGNNDYRVKDSFTGNTNGSIFDTSLVPSQPIFPRDKQSRIDWDTPGCFERDSDCPAINYVNKYNRPPAPAGWEKWDSSKPTPEPEPPPDGDTSAVVGLVVQFPDGSYGIIPQSANTEASRRMIPRNKKC